MTDLTPIAALGLVPADSLDADNTVIPLYIIEMADWQEWRDGAGAAHESWIAAQGFVAKAGAALCLPDGANGLGSAIGIIGDTPIWNAAAIAAALPAGHWSLDDFSGSGETLEQIIIGWGLSHYHFDTYRNATPARPLSALVLPKAASKKGMLERITGIVQGIVLCRDLINTPPNHMNPQGLEDAARGLADATGARIDVAMGETLANDFPAIDIVGRAAEIAPRLIDMRWGKKGPKITLVGKGITFDSGGLDLKPSKAMEMMKKDMGGSAIVLGLAAALMIANSNIQLRILIPAAENAVSDRAMRPLDVIDTRAGLKIEVGNTDAEGRLVLADALTLALEEDPDFLIDFATLTGAARVALGTELPALFANDDATAADIIAASNDADDALWRLPLFDDYERHLDAGYVTLSSTGPSGYGGAITAALFLRRFAGRDSNWAHVDVMAWNLGSRPGRPKGGEAMGLRALFRYISGLA